MLWHQGNDVTDTYTILVQLVGSRPTVMYFLVALRGRVPMRGTGSGLALSHKNKESDVHNGDN